MKVTVEQNRTKKLLLVEDEAIIAEPIMRGLREEGYDVDYADNGKEGEWMALSEDYDLLIIDWRLPGRSGLEVINRLRSTGCVVPILMMTALGEVEYRVAGLNSGADDYLTKPVFFEELLARIRALLRRVPTGQYEQMQLKLGPLVVDIAKRLVTVGNATLHLRLKEYEMLELLARHGGEAISRSMIADRVWGSDLEVTDNAINVTVAGLRRKLSVALRSSLGEQGDALVTIETVRGRGYRLLVKRDFHDSNRISDT